MDLVGKLAELGWLYRKVSGYVKLHMDARGRKTGLVGKAFCGSLHTELMEYYRLISTLEGQITVQTARSVNGGSATTCYAVFPFICCLSRGGG